jgi:hypothetical protein
VSFARVLAALTRPAPDRAFTRGGKPTMKLPRLRHVLLAGAGLVALAGCTPEEIAAFTKISAPYEDVLTNEQLGALRECESSGNYQAVSSNGLYRGAYQFNQSTWNGVARRHFPWLEGQDPSAAEPWWQDAMAKALWSESGARPWPHCGSRV